MPSKQVSPQSKVNVRYPPASAGAAQRFGADGVALSKPIGHRQQGQGQARIAQQRVQNLAIVLQSFFVLHHVPVLVHGQQIEPIVRSQQAGILGLHGKKLRPARKQRHEAVAQRGLVLEQHRDRPGPPVERRTDGFVDLFEPPGRPLGGGVEALGIQHPEVGRRKPVPAQPGGRLLQHGQSLGVGRKRRYSEQTNNGAPVDL